jgi:hypothetical protein
VVEPTLAIVLVGIDVFAAIVETVRPNKQESIDSMESFAKNERAKSVFDVGLMSRRVLVAQWF